MRANVRRSLLPIVEASYIKMADFMMDGAYFRAFDAVFGTVRQVLRYFDDGRSA